MADIKHAITIPTENLVFDVSGLSIEETVARHTEILQEMGGALHIINLFGLIRHKILGSVPTATQIAEGQFAIAQDGADWKLYTNLDGALYSITWTAE